MNVAELKAALDGVPDDATVFIRDALSYSKLSLEEVIATKRYSMKNFEVELSS